MISIWQETAQTPSFEPLEGDMTTDVLIIGGGIAGLLLANRLQNEGVPYALVEAQRIGHGVTKNTTAKITSQHGLIYDRLLRTLGVEKARLYLEANEQAISEYRALCDSIDCGFENKDAITYSLSSRELIEKEIDALSKIGFRAELDEQLPLPFSVAGAVRFCGQAQFHPLQFLSELAKPLRIYEHTPVREMRGCQAITDTGTITAKEVFVATHFPIINKHGSYFMKMYQERSYVLALSQAPDYQGMYVDAAKPGLSFRNAMGLLLLGGGSHRTGKSGGGWQALEDAAREYYPKAQEVARWATQDCMTLDGIPYIGQYAKSTPHMYVATGFQKWGMTGAMVAAMLLCDLLMGKRSPYEALYSPSRSMLHPQLAINACEAVMSLVSFSDKRCPHLGCALKWNAQERSWDCPCHGSRFSEQGGLIDNPATGDLKNTRRKKP